MSSAEHYERALYPLQDDVLAILSALDTRLYLSGGTAASRGYLGHRFSDDLDLFANDDAQFTLWADRVVFALAKHADMVGTVQLREARFVRATVRRADVELKVELINDVPSHVGVITVHPVLGRLDSADNILRDSCHRGRGCSLPTTSKFAKVALDILPAAWYTVLSCTSQRVRLLAAGPIAKLHATLSTS